MKKGQTAAIQGSLEHPLPLAFYRPGLSSAPCWYHSPSREWVLQEVLLAPGRPALAGSKSPLPSPEARTATTSSRACRARLQDICVALLSLAPHFLHISSEKIRLEMVDFL